MAWKWSSCCFRHIPVSRRCNVNCSKGKAARIDSTGSNRLFENWRASMVQHVLGAYESHKVGMKPGDYLDAVHLRRAEIAKVLEYEEPEGHSDSIPK